MFVGAEKPIYAPYRAKVAADVGAAKLWLTNRRGDQWREKSETDVNVKGDLAGILAARRAKAAKLDG